MTEPRVNTHPASGEPEQGESDMTDDLQLQVAGAAAVDAMTDFTVTSGAGTLEDMYGLAMSERLIDERRVNQEYLARRARREWQPARRPVRRHAARRVY